MITSTSSAITQISETGVPPVPPETLQKAAAGIARVHPREVISYEQRMALRRALRGRTVSLCFGAGVDSTAMMIALKGADIRPDVITCANTGGEKPSFMEHIEKMGSVLNRWGWPVIEVVQKVPKPETGYTDLLGNCLKNQTLPSIAFGSGGCAAKWKTTPQDQFLKGVSKGPNKRPPHHTWLRAQADGSRIVKLIGYDCGRADIRRSAKLKEADKDFDFIYPLQLIKWERVDCVRAIALTLGTSFVPVKSACYFCPATKIWELYWLAAVHPELLEAALRMEWVAMTGKHSRLSAAELGGSWEDVVLTASSFPAMSATVGLGRSYAWNQWARVNGVVDSDFHVRRDRRSEFLRLSESMQGHDNALDARSGEKLIEVAFHSRQGALKTKKESDQFFARESLDKKGIGAIDGQ